VPVPFDGTGSLDPQGSPLTYAWTFGDDGTAAGARAIHIYRSVGTFLVTLTVNDGFGGISQATASIMVNDVPPAFAPRAFTPPVTFAAPSPGDGFGASVASVAGNAAIGAPLDNGPSSTVHPGAVFLYDGVPTDDGVSTPHAYGALIHVFADPHPAAGDEFGAAIATVGNDLLIGAPGSSLTGPGDGAAADGHFRRLGTIGGARPMEMTWPIPRSPHEAPGSFLGRGGRGPWAAPSPRGPDHGPGQAASAAWSASAARPARDRHDRFPGGAGRGRPPDLGPLVADRPPDPPGPFPGLLGRGPTRGGDHGISTPFWRSATWRFRQNVGR
jgi:PKD repeat protein